MTCCDLINVVLFKNVYKMVKKKSNKHVIKKERVRQKETNRKKIAKVNHFAAEKTF